jgi:hypothetical protein
MPSMVRLPIDEMMEAAENFGNEKDPRPEYWRRLSELEAAGEVCAGTGVVRLEDGRLALRFLDEELQCDLKKRCFIRAKGDPVNDFLLEMVLLAYLYGHRRFPGETPSLPGKPVSPLQLATGEAFFRGPHAIPSDHLARVFSRDPKGFLQTGLVLGGRPWNRGDASFVLPVLPFVEMYFILYREDDEFPAKASLLVSESIEIYLTLDAVWGLCNLVIKRILQFRES